ncbi:MAG TPA: hypothetical protein VJL90_15720 [Pseudorhodoplanes sp.]|nr:hypothetical protein [Pseudorhodoplanes sp.]
MLNKIVISFGLTLAVLVIFTGDVVAQSSCGGWNATCRARCAERGEPNCPRCAQQMNNCKTTGCWTEAAKQGGKKHCNLTKS